MICAWISRTSDWGGEFPLFSKQRFFMRRRLPVSAVSGTETGIFVFLRAARLHPPGPGGRVRLIHQTDLSAGECISMEAWRFAKLESCPRHPGGGCGFARHGTCARKTPAGIRAQK